MARTHYTVTFPAASPGDEVTWPNTVAVYPDKDTQVPLQSGQTLNESLSFSGWSDATSIVFRRPAVANDTVTVTSGAPSGTGAAAPSSPGTSGPAAVSKTGAYTAADGDVVLCDASGGNFNVTAPAPALSDCFTVKNRGATGTVTIVPHASENIEGAASKAVLPSNAYTLISDGTDWSVI